jgi:hypothetical protein
MRKLKLYLFYGLLAAATIALAARPAATQATVIKSSGTGPLAGIQVNDPCNGDLITFTSGNLMIQSTLTFNGNNVSIDSEATQQGAKGTGAPSGLSYVAPAAETQHISVSTSLSSFPLEITFTFQASLISPSATNEKLVETVHMTINANGTTTANVVNAGILCAP